jgi:hypothetical protein
MILNRSRLCAIIIIFNGLTNSTKLLAKLTTLQHYDPTPIFSANDSMMPPNSQFLDLKQARFKNETPSKKKMFGLNVSGFIQGANRAIGYDGQTQYGTVVGIPENGFEMGDFRGTMYAMGLFLGTNPNTGYSIWVPGEEDSSDARQITDCSIRHFDLPACVAEAAAGLAGVTLTTSPTTCTNTAPAEGLTFNASSTPLNTPSIFSEGALADDTKYFGAFSMPIDYKKQGLRFEININGGDYFGLTIQSGFVNIQQKFTNSIVAQSSNATSGATAGQTAPGPYSLSELLTTPPTGGGSVAYISPLYAELNDQLGSGYAAYVAGTSPGPSQEIFNTWICNNLDNLLDPECGHKQNLCPFDEYSMEDVRVIMTLQKCFDPNRSRNDDDEDEWPDMLFTPYVWVGGTWPSATEINYKQLLSLPFGNNGHPSIGGGIGMTFDFAESVEVGVEGGGTYFFPKEENRPFPTHPLQRILYPFNANVQTSPGANWHFKALLNCYQFLKHVNFWLTYELIEHRKDDFRVCGPSDPQYFYPDVLTCVSDWRGQFFNAAIVFDIQPGLQASLVWQQPISPRNAYYPVSILGSINFMF